jgi:hypothetical protein
MVTPFGELHRKAEIRCGAVLSPHMEVNTKSYQLTLPTTL